MAARPATSLAEGSEALDRAAHPGHLEAFAEIAGGLRQVTIGAGGGLVPNPTIAARGGAGESPLQGTEPPQAARGDDAADESRQGSEALDRAARPGHLEAFARRG
jgi:hypothetical protein